MAAEVPPWVRDVLSPARFQPYLAVSHGDAEDAFRLYCWNVQVSEAFYTPLHYLELALRNSIHTQLSTHFARSEWWQVAPLTDNGRRIVASAVDKVIRRAGPGYEDGDVVSELSLGFWVSLVSRGGSYDRTLWVPALHRAFPSYRGPRQRLHDNLFSIVLLRNRIMHHEPVHHRDLHADHAKIYRLLGYISTEIAMTLQKSDRVPDVLRRKETCLR